MFLCPGEDLVTSIFLLKNSANLTDSVHLSHFDYKTLKVLRKLQVFAFSPASDRRPPAFKSLVERTASTLLEPYRFGTPFVFFAIIKLQKIYLRSSSPLRRQSPSERVHPGGQFACSWAHIKKQVFTCFFICAQERT